MAASTQVMTTGFPVSTPRGVGRRLGRIGVLLAVMALLSGAWAAYFAMSAGTDYPESPVQLGE